jgi:hypothetical protein
MYAMKEVASSVFQMMMFPHNKNIATINQITHYEPNHSANIDNILPNHSTNIDNILPLVHTSLDTYSVIDMSPNIFKEPYLLGAYHGMPPLLHTSTQVCVVSSNGTDVRDSIPPTEAFPHLHIPPLE